MQANIKLKRNTSDEKFLIGVKDFGKELSDEKCLIIQKENLYEFN